MNNIKRLRLIVCNSCLKTIISRSSCFSSVNKTFCQENKIFRRPASNDATVAQYFFHDTLIYTVKNHNNVLFSSYFEQRIGQSKNSIRTFSTEKGNDHNENIPPKKGKEPITKSPITWKLLVVVSAIGGGILLWMQNTKRQKQLTREHQRQKYLGKAKLGGDWNLVDHFGNKRSSTDFRGQWLLIYFGFTHCPDVCPAEIEKIVGVINRADNDPQLPKIQPLLITVDPDRDTPESLKEYCGEFSPRLLGFTGTSDEILSATRAYRVYYSAGPKDEDSDYIVDHSIISYLVNPQGEFVDFFGQDKTVDQMFTLIQFHINKYLKEEKKSQS